MELEFRIDRKGKYFTPHIAKDCIQVLVQTSSRLFVGQVHIEPGQRLKDALNADSSQFLAITDAQVYTEAGETRLFSSELVLVPYAQIIAISPLNAIGDLPEQPWATGVRC